MNVSDQKVVSFHYTLFNAQGVELESTRDRQPMSYLHGARNIIPGLENALTGKAAGGITQRGEIVVRGFVT